jgi:hypothetical protein
VGFSALLMIKERKWVERGKEKVKRANMEKERKALCFLKSTFFKLFLFFFLAFLFSHELSWFCCCLFH